MRLLDTNIVSLAMSGDPQILRRLAGLAPGQGAISAVTYAEIRYGLERRDGMERKRELFERLLEHLDVLPWDREAATAYAHERVACEREGRTLDRSDLMILAHAASTGRVLVTRDTALQGRNRKGRTRIVAW